MRWFYLFALSVILALASCGSEETQIRLFWPGRAPDKYPFPAGYD